MTLLDQVNKLFNDLSQFDENKPVLVYFDEKQYILTMYQLNKTIMVGYISNLFLNPKKVKIGILNQIGLANLRQQLMQLMSMQEFHDGVLTPSIGNLSISFYKLFRTKRLTGPQKILTLKFMNITNRFWVWFTCRYKSDELNVLYKMLKNENSNKDPEFESGTPQTSIT